MAATDQCAQSRRGKKKPAWRLSAWRRALFSGVILPSLAGAMEMPGGILPADQFRTDEYRATWALEKIHAADAYALGYTGKGVKVGVVDSGDVLDHAEFVGRTGPWTQPGRRYTEPFDEVGAHSTYVSGVLAAAKDGRGMHGVAYDAALIPVTGWGVKTSDDYAEAYFQTAAGIVDAVERGAQIINGSYGPPVLPSKKTLDGELNPKYSPQSMQMLHYLPELGELQFLSDEAKALHYAAAHDAVMVYAAGNHFGDHPKAAAHPSGMGLLPYIKPENHGSGVYRIVEGEVDLTGDEDGPDDYVTIAPNDSRLEDLDFSDLERHMIVVVATDKDDRITSYSNRCGVAWRWCIAAPGGEKPGDGESWGSTAMYTTTPDQGYTAERMRGTSLAAPMVSGALAVTKEAFPYMTMQQIREIVLTSANRTGHRADRYTYGLGTLDLGRAVRGPVEFGAEGFDPIFDVDTQGHDSWWRNDIKGVGGLTKRGAGTLVMTGNNTYTGPTTIKGGVLAVQGSNANSSLTVERDALLTGSGTVGSTQVSGTVAPANPGASLKVAGDYVQHTEGLYVVQLSEDGTASDRIDVQGKARIENAALWVDGVGLNTVNREYTVLQAAGGIQGDYAQMPDPYVFLDLEHGVQKDDPTRYRFAVTRNSTAFASAASTGNQRAVANALDTAGVGLAAYAATVMATDTDGLSRRFDHWSGEAHASTLSALSMQSQQARDSMLARTRAMSNGNGNGNGNGGDTSSQAQSVVRDDSGKAVWAQYAGSRDRRSGNGNAAGFDATSSGLMFGTDMPLSSARPNGTRLGLMAGFTNGNVKVNDRGSASKVDSYTVGMYGTTPLGDHASASSTATSRDGATGSAVSQAADGVVQLRYGAAHTWHSVSSKRDTAGLEEAEGRYKANTTQLFTEAGMPLQFGRTTVEPYAGLAYVNTRRRAFNESGNAGLHADVAKQSLGYSTLGLRANTSFDLKDGAQLALYGGAGWRHAYGKLTPVSRMRLAEGDSFDVHGTPIARDAMLVEAGASVYADRGMQLNLGYTGQLARGAQSHAVKANAVWRF